MEVQASTQVHLWRSASSGWSRGPTRRAARSSGERHQGRRHLEAVRGDGPGVSQEAVATQDGLHVWEDHFYPEVIDPLTGEVLPDGEEGELVFTSLTKQAMPVVRYRTRDLTRLLPGTAYPAFRRMQKVTGRTDDMMIVRGVNVFPTMVEEQILKVEGLTPHYLCVLTRPGNLDELTVQVEAHESVAEADREALGRRLAGHVKDNVGTTMRVEALARTRWSARWARRSGSPTGADAVPRPAGREPLGSWGSTSSGRVCMLRSLVAALTTALLAGAGAPVPATAAVTEPPTDRLPPRRRTGTPLGVPVGRQPRRRRPRLRPAPALGAADPHPGRRRAGPPGPGAGRPLPARPVRPAHRVPAGGDRPADRAAGRVHLAARRSAPRRLRARAGRRVDVRRGGGLPRPPGPHAGAVEPRRHGRARLADRAGRPGLDDAGAVRRVHAGTRSTTTRPTRRPTGSRSTCRGGGSGCPTAGWTAGASCTAAR